MPVIAIIFLGGGIGAVARHLFNIAVMHYYRGDFPLGIMLINITGSCLMGVLVGLFTKFALAQELRLFLTVGILGRFYHLFGLFTGCGPAA